jgi:hypothetical protein
VDAPVLDTSKVTGAIAKQRDVRVSPACHCELTDLVRADRKPLLVDRFDPDVRRGYLEAIAPRSAKRDGPGLGARSHSA